MEKPGARVSRRGTGLREVREGGGEKIDERRGVRREGGGHEERRMWERKEKREQKKDRGEGEVSQMRGTNMSNHVKGWTGVQPNVGNSKVTFL